MTAFPEKLEKKLTQRAQNNRLRRLTDNGDLIDFSSNDYLGLSRSKAIYQKASELVKLHGNTLNGASGSRLISGNYSLYNDLEHKLQGFHGVEAALVFNSGYDANLGFFSAIPGRGDYVFYDEFIHASIRDGIRMGLAKSYKFAHNDLADLERKIQLISKTSSTHAEVYVVTEAVFSMDGDSPDLKKFAAYTHANGYHFVVDEAHSIGVFGRQGRGLVQQLKLQDAVFARIITFGKAIGCHGAAILGSSKLKTFLINFARSLVYTTGLPPHSVASVLACYQYLSAISCETHARSNKNTQSTKETNRTPEEYHPIKTLQERIHFFKAKLIEPCLEHLAPMFLPSNSAIHCCIWPGNRAVGAAAAALQQAGFDVKAIRSPTVPAGKERLRLCLHSFNTTDNIERLLTVLSYYKASL